MRPKKTDITHKPNNNLPSVDPHVPSPALPWEILCMIVDLSLPAVETAYNNEGTPCFRYRNESFISHATDLGRTCKSFMKQVSQTISFEVQVAKQFYRELQELEHEHRLCCKSCPRTHCWMHHNSFSLDCISQRKQIQRMIWQKSIAEGICDFGYENMRICRPRVIREASINFALPWLPPPPGAIGHPWTEAERLAEEARHTGTARSDHMFRVMHLQRAKYDR